MKKLLMALAIILTLTFNANAIELLTIGTYLEKAPDCHWVDIQGELYTLDIESAPLDIQPGETVSLQFTLNEDDKVVRIDIISHKYQDVK